MEDYLNSPITGRGVLVLILAIIALVILFWSPPKDTNGGLAYD
jgi:hypothetical protein